MQPQGKGVKVRKVVQTHLWFYFSISLSFCFSFETKLGLNSPFSHLTPGPTWDAPITGVQNHV